MSFFKDFKEDLSQAVSELLPENIREEEIPAEEIAAEAVAEPVPEEDSDDISGLLSGLDDFSQQKTESESDDILPEIDMKAVEDILNAQVMEETPEVEEIPEEPAAAAEEIPEIVEETIEEPVEEIAEEPVAEEIPEVAVEPVAEETPEVAVEPVAEEIPEEPVAAEPAAEITENKTEEDNTMSEMENFANEPATDENGIITEGMTINGDVISKGSLEVLGCVKGNIEVRGKLDISGTINGNSKAAEIFADSAKITGEVESLGSVKIGQSTVVVGNISATSAVIAGAVKGDIDVHGPVIIDTSAIVMGNIKSKSVQINNGAVIEGHCSQCYAEVSPTSFFNDFK